MATTPTQSVTSPAFLSTIVEIVSAPFRPLAEIPLGYFPTVHEMSAVSPLGYFPTVRPADCSHDDLREVYEDSRCCRDCGEVFQCDHESQGASLTIWGDLADCSGCNATLAVIDCNECGWPLIEGIDASCENCTADAP